jgi:pyridoxamine 5'-phosphate oxidase
MSNPSVGLADLRTSYRRGELVEDVAGADPLALFQRWLQDALDAQLPEPTAMTLATVGPDLRPSTRIVLLKGTDAHGLIWYTNYESRKGRDLAGNPFAALQWHWVLHERTVRVEGRTQHLSAAENDAYFASRPLDSQVGAWASAQSEPVADRAAIEEAMRMQCERFGLQRQADGRLHSPGATTISVPRPPHWGGYRLVPDTWEFWQGRVSRLHDRLAYRRQSDGSWLRQRLNP